MSTPQDIEYTLQIRKEGDQFEPKPWLRRFYFLTG
jgi:hypothetical protein